MTLRIPPRTNSHGKRPVEGSGKTSRDVAQILVAQSIGSSVIAPRDNLPKNQRRTCRTFFVDLGFVVSGLVGRAVTHSVMGS